MQPVLEPVSDLFFGWLCELFHTITMSYLVNQLRAYIPAAAKTWNQSHDKAPVLKIHLVTVINQPLGLLP